MNLALLIGTNRRNLTANQQRIADFVLANPFHVATMGIEDLAKATATSPATITRFVRALGCASFGEFRGFAVQGYQSLLRPVENVDRARQIPPEQIVKDSLENAINAVKQLCATSGDINWEEIAARMVSAPRVGFLGFGVSANMLQYLADKTVSVVRSQVILNGAGGLERDAQKMLRFGPEDMVIAMALPRYSQATLDFLKIARGRGVHCIVVTDSTSSPLYAIGNERILVPAGHPVLHSSPIAALAVFEALIAVITAHHQSVSDAASMAHSLMPYLYADDENWPQSKPGNTNANEVE